MPFAANTADDRETRPPNEVAAFGELHSGIELAGAGRGGLLRKGADRIAAPHAPGLNSFEDMSEPPRGAHLVRTASGPQISGTRHSYQIRVDPKMDLNPGIGKNRLFGSPLNICFIERIWWVCTGSNCGPAD